MEPHVTAQHFRVRGPAMNNLPLPSLGTQVEADLAGEIAATATPHSV